MKKNNEVKNSATVGGIVGTVAAGIIGGPAALIGGAIGTAIVSGAVDQAEKSAIRKKYEGTKVETTTRKKDVPRDIRIAAGNKKR